MGFEVDRKQLRNYSKKTKPIWDLIVEYFNKIDGLEQLTQFPIVLKNFTVRRFRSKIGNLYERLTSKPGNFLMANKLNFIQNDVIEYDGCQVRWTKHNKVTSFKGLSDCDIAIEFINCGGYVPVAKLLSSSKLVIKPTNLQCVTKLERIAWKELTSILGNLSKQSTNSLRRAAVEVLSKKRYVWLISTMLSSENGTITFEKVTFDIPMILSMSFDIIVSRALRCRIGHSVKFGVDEILNVAVSVIDEKIGLIEEAEYELVADEFKKFACKEVDIIYKDDRPGLKLRVLDYLANPKQDNDFELNQYKLPVFSPIDESVKFIVYDNRESRVGLYLFFFGLCLKLLYGSNVGVIVSELGICGEPDGVEPCIERHLRRF